MKFVPDSGARNRKSAVAYYNYILPIAHFSLSGKCAKIREMADGGLRRYSIVPQPKNIVKKMGHAAAK